jgi:hypothetical protein
VSFIQQLFTVNVKKGKSLKKERALIAHSFLGLSVKVEKTNSLLMCALDGSITPPRARTSN